MAYASIDALPQKIRERYYMPEHEEFFLNLKKAFGFDDASMEKIFAVCSSILRGERNASTMGDAVREELPQHKDRAKQLIAELAGNYFLLFQDFVGPVEQLIADNGGDLKKYQERARMLLSPSVQLRDYLDPIIGAANLSLLDEETERKLIDCILDAPDSNDKTFRAKMREILGAAGCAGECSEAFEQLEYEPLSLLFRKEEKEYYRTLADKVLSASQTDKAFADPSQPRAGGRDYYADRQKYEALPDEVKQSLLSSAGAQQKLNSIEKKHAVILDDIVLRTAIGEIPLFELAIIIHKEFELPVDVASQVKDELLRELFQPVLSFFASGATVQGASKPVIASQLIDYAKEAKSLSDAAGVQLSSEIQERLERLITTRLRNVRSAVEVKERLSMPVEEGGIGLTGVQADTLSRALETRMKAVHAPHVLSSSAAEAVSGSTAGVSASMSGASSAQVSGSQAGGRGTSVSVASSAMGVSGTRRATNATGGTGVPGVSSVSSSGSMHSSSTSSVVTKGTRTPATSSVTSAPRKVGVPSTAATQNKTGASRASVSKPQDSAREKAEQKSGAAAPAHQSPEGRRPLVSGKAPKQYKPDLRKKDSPSLAIEDVDGVPTLVEKNGEADGARGIVPNSTKQPPLGAHALKVTVGAPSVQVRFGPQYGANARHLAGKKLVDAVEEYRLLTVADFRRLSSDPREAIRKLYDKLMAIQKNSFSKKMAAIDAWKESEVNRLYVQMGHENLSKGIPMSEVIAQRKAAGTPALSEAEFDAILEFNEMIQF